MVFMLSFDCYAFSEAELEWLEDDEETITVEVNEGELRFLPLITGQTEYRFRNEMTITMDSLSSGWVGLEQCHYQLDAVPSLDITYRAGGIRDINVTSAQHINRYEVNTSSVSLFNLNPGASICITAETRALRRTDEGYELSNGPFMRRFLDGFYPMSVDLKIDYSTTSLVLDDVYPESQVFWSPRIKDQYVHVLARFEGMLKTRLQFSASSAVTK